MLLVAQLISIAYIVAITLAFIHAYKTRAPQ